MDLETTAEEAYKKVDEALGQANIEFTRTIGLQYNIPNFGAGFEQIVNIADQALSGTPFYAQEMPYRETMPEFTPDHMLVLHRDSGK